MKKSRILMLALIFILMCATLVLVSCGDEEHTHTFSDTWSQDDTGHWHAATCEHDTEKSGWAEHSWDAGTVTTPATETANGVKTFTCTVCARTKTEEIPMLSHTHTYASELTYDENGHWYPSTCGHADAKKDYAEHVYSHTTTAPTCTDDGYTTHTCACEYNYTDTPTAKLNHDWEVVANSDNGDGTHDVVCKHDATHTNTLGHDYTDDVTAPTCETDGYTTHTCACGKSFTSDTVLALNHSWEIVSHNSDGTHNLVCKNDEAHTKTVNCVLEEQIVLPTCDTDGYTRHYCECGYEYSDTPVSKLGHDWEIVSKNSDGTHNVRCKNNSEHTDTVACDYAKSQVVTAPTCEADGYTTYTCACGNTKVDNRVSAIGHDYEVLSSNSDGTHNLVCNNDEKHTKVAACEYSKDVKAPSCEDEGYTTYTCECGHSYKGDYTDPIGHDWSEWTHTIDHKHMRTCGNRCSTYMEVADCKYTATVIAPTCTTEGWTHYECKDCGHEYIDSYVDALGHDWGDWTYNGDGTHTRVCETDEKHTEAKACNDNAVVTSPTCEEDGYTTHTCDICEYSYTDTPVDKLGHSYGDWESDGDGTHTRVCANDEAHTETVDCDYETKVTAPGCTTAGYTTYTCKVCGYSETGDPTEPTGHTYSSEWSSDDFYHWRASTCCNNEKDGYAEHSFNIFVETVDVSCEEDGYDIYKCVCGKTTQKNIVEKTGHSYGTPIEASRADIPGETCAKLVTYEATCANCDKKDIQSKTEYFHNFETYSTPISGCTATGDDIAHAATCKEGGISHKHCTVAGCEYNTKPYEIITTEINPDGHVWDAGTQNGSTVTYQCIHCEQTKNTVVSDGSSATVGGNVDEVVLGDTTITMNGTMKDNLTGEGDVTISTGTTTKEDLSNDINTDGIPDDATIYEFTVNGTDAEFGDGGEATITIPYRLGEGQDPNSVIVWYISNGEPIAIPATYWEDAEGNGFATFTTGHFSYYVPATVTPEEMCRLFGKHSDNLHVVEATCTTGGYTVCLRCNEVIETTEALGHKWIATVTTEATCTTNGTTHHACAECDMAYDVTVAATGHYYVLSEHTVATCHAEGRSVYGCIYCSDEYVVTTPQLVHSYVTRTVAPTCTERGYTHRSCTACGDEQITYTAALGHKYDTAWASAEEGHYHTCTVCGARDKVLAHTPGAEATEQSAQLCVDCGYVLVPQLAHQHKNMTHFDANEATCTQSGNTEYYVCSCNKWFLDSNGTQLIVDHTSVIIDAKGHTPVAIDYLAPTCTTAGHTAGARCDECNALLRGNIAIAATGHEYMQTVKTPTCTEGGYTTYTCQGCGDSYQANETAPLNHRYTSVITKPTCTEAGYTTYTCALCSDSYNGNNVAALGHNFSKTWTTDENGHWHTCSRCDTVDASANHIRDYAEATESHGVSCTVCRYEIAPMLDHTHEAASSVAAVEATCTAAGNIEYYICDCGDWFYDADCTNVIYNRVTVIIPSSGHSLVYHRQTNATCQSVGYTAGYYCTVCNQYISGHTEIPVSVHSYSVLEYDEDGHWYRCIACNETNEALEHEYTNVTTQPTCTRAGYTVHTCACGYEYIETINAPGHSWGEWESNYDGTHTRVCATDPRHMQIAACESFTDKVVEPTCTARGYTLHTCDDCGYSFTDSFTKALGHTYGEYQSMQDGTHIAVCANDNSHTVTFNCNYVKTVTAPTCTEKGYTAYTCAECDYSYVGDYKDALGHDFGEWVSNGDGTHTHTCENNEEHTETVDCSYTSVVTAPDCENRGYTTHTCDICGYSFVDSYVDALGHNFDSVVSNYNGTHYLVCANDASHKQTVACEYRDEVLAPTCENGGYTKHICDACGHSKIDTYTDALGHKWGAWTADSVGHHVSVCENDQTHTRQEACNYLSVVTPVTCENDGYTTHTCTVCEHQYIDEVYNALGHDYGAWVSNGDGTHTCTCQNDASHKLTDDCVYEEQSAVPPTCTEKGYTVYGCECGHSYRGNYTDALGHSFTEWTSNGDGTHSSVCANDESHTKTVSCTYESHIVAPTCTERGYTSMSCTECGHGSIGNYIEALGHKWGGWTHNTDKTHTRVCEHDRSHTETVACEYTATVKAPTCTEKGYTIHTCTACGDSYTDNIVDMIPHNYVNGKCTVCGAEEISQYAYNTVLVAKTDNGDGTTTVSVSIKNMSLAGIRFRLSYKGMVFEGAECIKDAAFHDNGAELNFVLSYGEVTESDDAQILNIRFNTVNTARGDFNLEVIEILTFTENGDIVTPGYSVIYAD